MTTGYWNLGKITQEEVNRVLKEQHPIKHFPKGYVLYRQEEENNTMYLLLEGRVELNWINSEGRKKIISISEPMQLCGESNLLNCECLTDVTVAAIQKNELIDWEKEMLLVLFESLNWKLRTMVNQIANQTFKDAESRIEDLLGELATLYGKTTKAGIEVDVPLTHQAIGDIIGSSRVEVSRSMSKMNRKNKLEVSNNKRYTLYR